MRKIKCRYVLCDAWISCYHYLIKNDLCGQASFWLKVIGFQQFLIEYLEIADANSIFADVKSVEQL